jgi:hypothetical protein
LKSQLRLYITVTLNCSKINWGLISEQKNKNNVKKVFESGL